MADITISLTEQQMGSLRELFERLGVSTEELVRVGVEDMLGGLDGDIAAHIETLLLKNRDLYDRLAG